MHTAIATLEGISPMIQGRAHNEDKLNKEAPDDYEKRTWMKKAHVNEQGIVTISPFAHKNVMADAAKYLSIQIPGKGKSTYTKHVEAGVMCLNATPILINGKPMMADQLIKYEMFVPSDGVSGSGKRVYKYFPMIPPGWQTVVEFIITDDVLTEAPFRNILEQAGSLIGLGSFRVRNKGICGRFQVLKMEWAETKI